MTKYTETRTLSASKLRSLCINHNWYTCGDSSEYENLFRLLSDTNGNPINLGTDNLAEIAVDIKEHSETEYSIPDIMFELADACVTYFDEL